jgi:hypothetical protein
MIITLEVSRWIPNTEIGLVIFFTQTSSTMMQVRYAHHQGQKLNETFDNDSFTQNLVERENDSRFSGSLAKSCDAYFNLVTETPKKITECSTMSRSIKTDGTVKANQDS